MDRSDGPRYDRPRELVSRLAYAFIEKLTLNSVHSSRMPLDLGRRESRLAL